MHCRWQCGAHCNEQGSRGVDESPISQRYDWLVCSWGCWNCCRSLKAAPFHCISKNLFAFRLSGTCHDYFDHRQVLARGHISSRPATCLHHSIWSVHHSRGKGGTQLTCHLIWLHALLLHCCAPLSAHQWWVTLHVSVHQIVQFLHAVVADIALGLVYMLIKRKQIKTLFSWSTLYSLCQHTVSNMPNGATFGST